MRLMVVYLDPGKVEAAVLVRERERLVEPEEGFIERPGFCEVVDEEGDMRKTDNGGAVRDAAAGNGQQRHRKDLARSFIFSPEATSDGGGRLTLSTPRFPRAQCAVGDP